MRTWLGVIVALALPAGAHAAMPEPGAAFSVDDHATPGDNWHVDLTVGSDPAVVKGLVVYAERCGGETPFAVGLPIDAEGAVSHRAPIDPDDPERGSWSFEARFTEAHRLDGSFRITTAGCDTGPIVFVAQTGGDQAHGVAYGPPHGTLPDLSAATPYRRAQVRRLFRATRRSARKRFPTVRAALRRGFHSSGIDRARLRPHVYHVRNDVYGDDRDYLNPRRPEALVIYNPPRGRPVVLAFMYRYPLGPWPPFGRPLLAWHSHNRGLWRGIPNQMTHVWLTRDLRSALANCLPVKQLEAAIPRFEFKLPERIDNHESRPCPRQAAG